MFGFAAAVKFGRMSKKQREKVEDEVRYHRAAQQRAQQVEIPDTTISSYNEGHQTPSSTDPHIFPNTTGYVSTATQLLEMHFQSFIFVFMHFQNCKMVKFKIWSQIIFFNGHSILITGKTTSILKYGILIYCEHI